MQLAPRGAREAYERLTPQQKAEGLGTMKDCKDYLAELGLPGGVLDADGTLVWKTPVKEKQ
jgi:hypothetical protein